MHRTVGTLLVHILEFPCICILCLWWVSLLLADFHLVAFCLFVCSQQLVVAGYYYYYCLSNNQWWLCTKIGVASLLLDLYTGRDGWLFQASYICVYLVSEVWGCYTCDYVHRYTYHYHSCWWMDKQFNISWRYQMYGANYIYATWWILISCKKLLGSAKLFLIYAYSFQAVLYD